VERDKHAYACACVCGLWQTDGQTPLFVASQNGHVAVVKALVKARATVDQATVCDCMPLSAACRLWCARMSLVRRTRVEIL
jgi:hypothetical protein